MKNILTLIQQFLFPTSCALCQTYQATLTPICRDCQDDLPWIAHGCAQCGEAISPPQTHCGHCLAIPPHFDRLFSLFQFEEPITSLIHELKFREKLYQSLLFGQLLLQKIQTNWYQGSPLPQAIIPIPLHNTRLKARGFNQAIEIARPLARNLSIPLEKKICQRIKPTPPQADLAAKFRAKNIKNAFICMTKVPYQHIALVDDVVTTGSTVSELARVLKKAGVEKVDVWCCARTQKSRFSYE